MSIEISTELVVYDYFASKPGGRERGGIWVKGRRIVRITYTHGYGTVPEGVQAERTDAAFMAPAAPEQRGPMTFAEWQAEAARLIAESQRRRG